MKFEVNPRNWAYGTSLQGYVAASYAELAAIFGPADDANRDGDGKVSTEWLLRFEDGTEATVYDYKDTSLYDEGLPSVEEFRALPSFEWHIGGKGPSAVYYVTQTIENARKAPPRFNLTGKPGDKGSYGAPDPAPAVVTLTLTVEQASALEWIADFGHDEKKELLRIIPDEYTPDELSTQKTDLRTASDAIGILQGAIKLAKGA